MVLMLLFLGCNRTSCESRTLTTLADARCQAWRACPEFAPFVFETYEDHVACVDSMTRYERDICMWATEPPCNGKLSPARVLDCAEANLEAIETCDWVPRCTYVDTGFSGDAMYQEVELACKSETE
ncbi:hypothetical protein L6R49_25415 [Myxococcota bacterium]|nr:hypothetical protein [Myxococcota bacterium]